MTQVPPQWYPGHDAYYGYAHWVCSHGCLIDRKDEGLFDEGLRGMRARGQPMLVVDARLPVT